MTDDNFDVPVIVQVPRRRFKTLNQQAMQQAIPVSTILRSLVIRLIPEAPIPLNLTGQERDDYIRLRNSEGAIDVTIALELGSSKTQVAYRRKQLGIDPVRKHRQEADA